MRAGYGAIAAVFIIPPRARSLQYHWHCTGSHVKSTRHWPSNLTTSFSGERSKLQTNTAEFAGDPSPTFFYASQTGNCIGMNTQWVMRDAIEDDLRRVFEIRVAALQDDFGLV